MPPSATSSVRVIFHDDGNLSDHSSSSLGKSEDYQKKNLRDRLNGSIDASIDFLLYNGVAKSSIAELRLAQSKARFLPVVERIQEYVECYVQNLKSLEEKQAASYMTLQAWKALTDYTKLIHQRVYAEYNELLLSLPSSSSAKTVEHRELIKEKQQYMIKIAEYSCSSQTGLMRARVWENRLADAQ